MKTRSTDPVNLYGIPLAEQMSPEEFAESFLELCHVARLLTDAEFVSRKHFAQDVGAYTATDWRLNLHRRF